MEIEAATLAAWSDMQLDKCSCSRNHGQPCSRGGSQAGNLLQGLVDESMCLVRVADEDEGHIAMDLIRQSWAGGREAWLYRDRVHLSPAYSIC